MPRGVQRSLEDRLVELESQKSELSSKIESWKEKISEIDTQIQDLKDEQERKEVSKLLEAIKASGKTPEEILASMDKLDNETH